MARVKKESGTPTPEAPAAAASTSPEIDLAKVAAPDNGAALAIELAKADKATIIDNAKAVRFDNAHTAVEKLVDHRMPALVKRTFAPLDWEKVLDRFDAWMALGDKRTDEQFIRKAHEEGPEILGSVQDMYVQVKFAREAWELDNTIMLGLLRKEAREMLETMKAKKLITKTITIDDVTEEAASNHPEEFAAQEKQRRQYTLVEERAKHCVERGTIRCRHLDTMMHKLR